MLAISRCFSALIAANPRFEPPELLLFEVGIPILLSNGCEIITRNAHRAAPFTTLIEVKQLRSRAFQGARQLRQRRPPRLGENSRWRRDIADSGGGPMVGLNISTEHPVPN